MRLVVILKIFFDFSPKRCQATTSRLASVFRGGTRGRRVGRPLCRLRTVSMATQLGSIKRVRNFKGFVVDGFNYQSPVVVAYFLTHFHADHTCGLHAGFKGPAPIYCTAITASLLTNVMGVKPGFVRAVQMHEEIEVRTSDGQTAFVTFLDANHCPGSATIYFRKSDGETKETKERNITALHTGDFRAAKCVREDPRLHHLIHKNGPIGELYLDTTYCDPKWRFPDQAEVLSTMGAIAKRELIREPRTLFLVGSYSIGKEKAVRAVANAVQSKVAVGWHRARTLKLTGWWDDALFICEDDERAMTGTGAESLDRRSGEASTSSGVVTPPTPLFRVRVSPMGGGPPHENMLRLLKESLEPQTGLPYFKSVVSFRPTGWSYAKRLAGESIDIGKDFDTDEALYFKQKGENAASKYTPWVENDGATRVYGVPYSEHSSFTELVAFVQRVRPTKIVPTVNVASEADRFKILKHFQHLTDARKDKGRLEHYFGSGKRKASEVEEETEVEPSDELRGVCSETLEALKNILSSPAEFKQQVELLREAERNKVKKDEANDPSTTPFPLGCVALVRGGGGGFGGSGPKYTQFRDKQHVESRLVLLGAQIVGRVSPKVTHVVVPGRGEALTEERRRHGLDAETGGGIVGVGVTGGVGVKTGNHTAGGKSGYEANTSVSTKQEPVDSKVSNESNYKQHNPSVQIVSEAWVMRHWRAFQSGTAKEHAPDDIKNFQLHVAEEKKLAAKEKKDNEKRKKEAIDAGEDVRRGRERIMSRAVLDRVARALNQRLFLVQRRDLGRGPTEKWRAVFAVFGTTGNVYECEISECPSCKCPDFVGGRKGGPGTPGSRVCKHLLWLYMRVLGVSRDDPLVCQTSLTQSELKNILDKPTAAQRATLAAASARRAYAAREGGMTGVEDITPTQVNRKPPKNLESDSSEEEETCPVCFDPIVDAAELARGKSPHDCQSVWWCSLGCGSNVHASCMRRWMEKSNTGGGGTRATATCPLCRAQWMEQGMEPNETAVDAPVSVSETNVENNPHVLSPGGTRYVNLARFQQGTNTGRDLGGYNDFARRAIEKRQQEEKRRESTD